MSQVAEREKTELVIVPAKEKALDVFKAKQGLDPYLQTIRQEVDNFLTDPPSLETAKGRQAYASMAHKIARSKTAIDVVGKELVADIKELPKKIDAERKRWRDTLDAWKDEARQPLTDWESAEESRKARHQERIEHIRTFESFEGLTAAGMKVQLDNLESISVGVSFEEYEAEAHRIKDQTAKVLRAAIEKQERHEAEQAELESLRAEQAAREQKEREQRLVREAEERARREAEQAAQAEREAVARREQAAKHEAERREREAKEAAERREQEHQEAIAKAQRESEQERQRIEDEHRRKEQARVDAERREQEEAAKRQANKEHRATINRAALQAMVDGGMPEDCAKQAIILIAQGAVPSVTIQY